MQVTSITHENVPIALVQSDAVVMKDAQSALDLVMTVQYETGSSRMVLNKDAVCSGFFILSTGLAGEILQKFINYHVKLALVGDYRGYTSKPLRDFIYESNQGRDIFFAATQEEALKKLARA